MKVTKSEATSTTELVEEDVYTPKGKLTFNMAAETQEGEGGGLSRLQTSFVLGYHGCGRPVCEKTLEGKTKLTKGNEDNDWLGPGIYFWESDLKRALEWAKENISSFSAWLQHSETVLTKCLEII